MALTREQVEDLLRRCQQRRRLWELVALGEAWARAAWPGLVAVLVALAIARACGWTLIWVGPAAALVLLGSLAWALRGRAALRVPGWWLPARVDRAAGAHGALMACFERRPSDQPVPLSALRVALGPAWPWRTILATVGLLGAYALCLAIPVPNAQARAVVPLTPLPVQRAQRWLQRVEPKDATSKLFVDSSRKTLARLAAKSSGLERADFDALERIEQRARSLLEKQATARAAKQETLDALRDLDSLLASYEAKAGENGTARALQQALERKREALERGGLSRQQLEQMLQQAQQAAQQQQQGKGQGKGDGQGQGGFDPDAAEDLRKALQQQMRELQLGSGEGDGEERPGKGGLDRGPGFAPLELSEQERVPDATFEASTFATAKDDRTVLLGTGLSRREDQRQRDPQGQSGRAFEAGTDTQLWPKHVEPRHRAVLERYFRGQER